MNTRKLTMKGVLESILGVPGGICSWSKTMGPAMAVYNSKVFIDGDSIWHGDIVLNPTTRSILERFARDNDIVITVEYESGGEVWSTSDPKKMDGRPIEEAILLREKRSTERKTARLVSYGILTPRGTDWKWYNTWFYKTIWAFFAYIHSWIHIFLVFPYTFTKMSKLTFWGHVREYFRVMRKEFWYQRFEGGLLHIGGLKLKEGTQAPWGAEAPGN
jgi:hypothetical protein